MIPEVHHELGVLISQMMAAPVTYDPKARRAELLRRLAERTRMIEIGQQVQTVADLHVALAAAGIDEGNSMP
jgi:hypothetical protein